MQPHAAGEQESPSASAAGLFVFVHPSHSFCGFVGASLLAKLWRGLIREQARSYRRRVENREAFSTVLLHWWKSLRRFPPYAAAVPFRLAHFTRQSPA